MVSRREIELKAMLTEDCNEGLFLADIARMMAQWDRVIFQLMVKRREEVKDDKQAT